MIAFRRCRRPLALVLALAACIPATGCSLGYTNLRPYENSALYTGLFSDIINRYDEPYWLWIRGTIAGDFEGDSLVDEEAVIATIQKGTPRNPGPIEMAFLVICEINKDGTRTAMTRTLLFDGDPFAKAPRPTNDLAQVVSIPLTHVRAQLVQDKVALTETVVVYFWGDTLPGSVWYAGYNIKDGALVKILETALWQKTPGFMTANLDRSIGASPFGYQLMFSVAAIPDAVMAKINRIRAHDTPLWGHVFARDAEGIYRQADQRFGVHYRELENTWNQTYLRAVLNDLPPADLAWFEYHMGIMNRYTENTDMATRFLQKAAKDAQDPILIKAIHTALDGPDQGETGK